MSHVVALFGTQYDLIHHLISDAVRLREERRPGAKSHNSRRSSTDSSEDGFNLNVRDLKVGIHSSAYSFQLSPTVALSLCSSDPPKFSVLTTYLKSV